MSLGRSFGFQKLNPSPVSLLFLLPADPYVEPSAISPAPRLPEYCHAGNGLNSKTVGKPQLNALRLAMVMVSFHRSRTLTKESVLSCHVQ